MPKTGAKAYRDCPGWHVRAHLRIEKKKSLFVVVVQQLYWMLLQLLTKSAPMLHCHSFPVATPKNSMKSRVISTHSCLKKKQTTIKVSLLHCSLPGPGLWFLMLPLIMCSAQLLHPSLLGQALGSMLTEVQWIECCGCSREGSYKVVHSLRLDAQKHIYSVSHM